jgi:hypothetical protein
LIQKKQKIKDNPIGSARLSGQRHWINSLSIIYSPNTENYEKASAPIGPEKKIKILIIYCFTAWTQQLIVFRKVYF